MRIYNIKDYYKFCINWANDNFKSFSDLLEQEAQFNAYPNLNALSLPKETIAYDKGFNKINIIDAEEDVLKGKIFWEHTAAGEATRLNMGPKYLITPSGLEYNLILNKLNAETNTSWNLETVKKWLKYNPKELLNISLGNRHILQKTFEIVKLAEKYGENPLEVLKRQKMLIIISQNIYNEIKEIILEKFSKIFKLENILLMQQSSFYGLAWHKENGWFFDSKSPKYLHNHGQMAMQKTWDDEIFYFTKSGQEVYLKFDNFLKDLSSAEDLVSYSIEDLGYLTSALDLEKIALALNKSKEFYGMTMEIVANDEENPIKGGLYAHDEILKKDVVIESFRLRDMPNREIKFLNKNFNHYPKPEKIFSLLKEKGLFLPINIKDNYLYYQPVQGDLNFLTKTAFIKSHGKQSICSLKSVIDIAKTVEAMYLQDNNIGFKNFLKDYFN